jgi:uncharacterized protein (DUF2062 family)
MGRVREAVRRLVARDGTPRGIAGGFALGLALSLVPIPGAGMVVALALAPLLHFNLPATYAGTAVVNPMTGPFIYFAELWLGLLIAGQPVPRWDALADLDMAGWWALLQQMVGPFMLGASVLMMLGASVSFSLLWLAARSYRRRHPAGHGTQTHEGDDR